MGWKLEIAMDSLGKAYNEVRNIKFGMTKWVEES
jgi:hypothetical protein